MDEQTGEKPTIDYEATVAGRQVRFKRRLPHREARQLWSLIDAASKDGAADDVPIMRLVIESWDFPGDPADPAAYESLDEIDEIRPLGRACGRYVGQRIRAADEAKN